MRRKNYEIFQGPINTVLLLYFQNCGQSGVFHSPGREALTYVRETSLTLNPSGDSSRVE